LETNLYETTPISENQITENEINSVKKNSFIKGNGKINNLLNFSTSEPLPLNYSSINAMVLKYTYKYHTDWVNCL
jgi:hypothetical protein